jgi:hypothetical protein
MGLSVVLDVFGNPRVRFPYLYGRDLAWYQDRAIGEVPPKWLSPRGQKPAVFNANAIVVSKDRGGLWIVEGPCDVMALLSTFEAPSVVGIPGAGTFLPSWVPAFEGLHWIFIVGDNDEAGLKFRSRVEALLSPVVENFMHVHVAEPFNDLDEWRRACGTEEPEMFGSQLFAAVDSTQG